MIIHASCIDIIISSFLISFMYFFQIYHNSYFYTFWTMSFNQYCQSSFQSILFNVHTDTMFVMHTRLSYRFMCKFFVFLSYSITIKTLKQFGIFIPYIMHVHVCMYHVYFLFIFVPHYVCNIAPLRRLKLYNCVLALHPLV